MNWDNGMFKAKHKVPILISNQIHGTRLLQLTPRNEERKWNHKKYLKQAKFRFTQPVKYEKKYVGGGCTTILSVTGLTITGSI